ncbi:S1 family peptidase [Bdellovibrio sp. HCB337]|uniref:S1 family peptidase n=1 Tax=Bdellovibrio sp. HCB337 TaxID=3394358 RepID=UPI0039A738BE
MTNWWVRIFGIGIVLLSLSACQPAKDMAEIKGQSGNAIIGGEDVQEDNPLANLVVGIVRQSELDSTDLSLCTGTFITPDVILTAAHCVPDTNRPDLLFVQQKTELSRDLSTMLPIKAFVRHDKYVNSPSLIKNDVALIQLKEPIPTAKIAIFKIDLGPIATSWDFIGLGYGRSIGTPGTSIGNGTLRTTTFTGLFFEPDLYYFKIPMSETHGMCNGDSGGPALYKAEDQYAVLGVASYVEKRGDIECSWVGTYSNVQFYRGWIEERLKEWGQ